MRLSLLRLGLAMQPRDLVIRRSGIANSAYPKVCVAITVVAVNAWLQHRATADDEPTVDAAFAYLRARRRFDPRRAAARRSRATGSRRRRAASPRASRATRTAPS